eukprot:CAMPEP_0180412686 /NCGR_PEP_ID=MMETSP0989-20121125/44672_1 /TAXON_ID=697907 /ORGANISM="non described non described, Strain CCMP2293" /LENGTH=166 /DNA_ID=CAMNT_0022417167 /DNA_START=64 /DNA_END=563 /DNA_ORIENTATION=-
MPLGSAIVLGVGPGIGAAVAKKWAAEGYKVACVCRNAEKAERIATEVGRGAVGFSCDVTDEAALKSTLAKIETALGPADFLCYNAGSGMLQEAVRDHGGGVRAWLALRDMGPKGVHVFLAIIDGGVGDGEQKIAPSDIAQTYWDVAKQGKSCWTHEIDVRPFNENW